VEVPSLATSVDVVDLPELLRSRPPGLACIGIDIPIGLLNGSRACDKAARKLLGQPRGTSVFAAPCRAALSATTHREASQINREETGRGLSQQAFGIISKIKQVDDAITSDCQMLARARIAAAQRARWAKVRRNGGQKQNVVGMPKKKTMSAAARKKIATAQRARWAKIKAAQRKSA